MEPKEWEQALLLRVGPPSKQSWLPNRGVVVDDIRLDGEYPDTEVVFEFRSTRRPAECRFGWRWGPIWEAMHLEGYDVADLANVSPNLMATMICANLIEAIDLRLPAACLSGEITWFQ